MNFDDTLLMAYVDGELPPSRHAEIERAVAASDDLAARVADLRASAALPYREAFSRQPMPPVPDSLTRFVAELALDDARGVRAGVHTASFDAAVEETAEAAPAAAIPGVLPFPARPARARFSSAWLAAAFVAGAFFCGAALRLGPHLPLPFGARVAPWVEAAAGYQELYTRETLADTSDNPPVDARVLDEIHHDDGLPLAIPDLQKAGLTFKRLQRLRFHGKPLVQIVYLPEHGAPVALCVIRNQADDQSVQSRRVYGMDVVTWNRDKLGYALIGQRADVDLPALARQIAENPDKPLASNNETKAGATDVKGT
jgi:anti-sigma factor RsiW